MGDKTIPEHINEDMVRILHTVEGKGLNKDAPVTALVAVKTNLDAFIEETRKWDVPFDWKTEQMTFDKHLKDWSKAIKGIQNLQDNIHRIYRDTKAATAALKKKWHEQKAKVVKWVDKSTTNAVDVLSSMYGELLYQRAYPPEEIGIESPWVCRASSEDLLKGDAATFKEEPIIFVPIDSGAGTVEHATHLDQSYYDFMKRIIPNVRERIESATQALSKPKVKQGMVLGTLVIQGGHFPWNGKTEEDCDFFRPLDGLPTFVLTKRCMFQDLSTLPNCFRGLSMMMTSCSGDVCVFFITPTQFAEHPDIKSWLTKCESKEVAKNPAAVLHEGESCFVPSGWIPLWLPLPDDVDLMQKRPSLAARGRNSQG